MRGGVRPRGVRLRSPPQSCPPAPATPQRQEPRQAPGPVLSLQRESEQDRLRGAPALELSVREARGEVSDILWGGRGMERSLDSEKGREGGGCSIGPEV